MGSCDAPASLAAIDGRGHGRRVAQDSRFACDKVGAMAVRGLTNVSGLRVEIDDDLEAAAFAIAPHDAAAEALDVALNYPQSKSLMAVRGEGHAIHLDGFGAMRNIAIEEPRQHVRIDSGPAIGDADARDVVGALEAEIHR